MTKALQLMASLLLLCLALTAQANVFFKIDPRGAYLRTYDDSPQPALTIDLQQYGWLPGDSISLAAVGDFAACYGWTDNWTAVIAVFSTSNQLSGTDYQLRVPGAIDAGQDYTTGATCYGSLPTDIPEDFYVPISSGVTIGIPQGARYLFVTAGDNHYGDNNDPDNDFGVVITPVPEPSSLIIFLSGGAGLCGFALRRRK